MQLKQSGVRDGFQSRWGFILACIGSAVGMGNIWLFPYRLGQLGGFAFLIPYIICVIVLGYTGVCEEIGLGRSTRRGPIGAFGMALESRHKNKNIGRALGIIPMVGALAIGIGYSVVMAWILRYTVLSITGTAFRAENPAAFFGMAAGPYSAVWWQLGALLICFIIMSIGVAKGIERINKFMMPAFFFLFLILAIRVIFLSGSGAGYSYIFKPVWSKILDPMTWAYAMGQAFFSLSLAGNGTVIYGSYFSDEEDILKSARNIVVFDSIAAMLAAFVIIPACYAFGQEVNAGPGLMFITLPHVFQSMPAGQIFMIIFFVAVLFAGITSMINLFETPIAALQDQLGLSRPVAVGIIGIIAAIVGVIIEGIVATWMDIVSIFIIPLGAALAAVMFFLVFGRKYVESAWAKGRSQGKPKHLYKVGIVFVVLVFIVWILGIISYIATGSGIG